MVKAVVGEEAQLKLAEDRLAQSSLPSQVGLVIGRLSSALDRGFVFDLVPTPPNDSGEPSCSLIESFKDDKKKGSKPKSMAHDSSSLVIDKGWVAEHARQVSRMLVGGMKVVGIYVWVSDTAFKNSTIMLFETVKEVAEAAPLPATDLEERLLIHICYSPRRWTCRNCMPTSSITSNSLRPCDFKMSRVLASLQIFKCTYNFSFRLPIYHESASKNQRLSEVIHNMIVVHALELQGAKVIIDGSLVVDGEQCASGDTHEVELLLPILQDASVEACSKKVVDGNLVFSGSVCCIAYLNSKEPISQAIAEIKGDILTSLQSRLDLICDEADGDSGPTDDVGGETSEISSQQPLSQLILNSLKKRCALSFPRRVFVPWLGCTYICDYLQPSDSLEVLKDHCVELMSMEASIDESTIFDPEEEAPSLTTGSFWDVAHPSNTASGSCKEDRELDSTRVESKAKSKTLSNGNFVTAVLFLILSILVGLGLIVVRGSS